MNHKYRLDYVLFWSCLTIIGIQQSYCYSVHPEHYDLIKLRCFNRSRIDGNELKLGQYEPIGISVENLISMIEKFERLNPNLGPVSVLRMLLKRFHLDGLHFNEVENLPSNIQVHQSQITELILNEGSPIYSNQDPPFPEHQFTEEEKCNLFFSISHFVNETAIEGEKYSNVVFVDELSVVRSTGPLNSRDMGEEIPITLNTSTTTESLLNRSNRSRRKSRQYIRTRRPREYGVASFLSADTNPISMNRVLLGMLVGFAQTRSQKVGELIVALSGKRATAEIENESLNPLLAVTLADLYGISKDDMVYSEYDNIFGAEGKWNNSICHTDYILNDNEGLWATLAEFRGGLDGYYIGLTIQSLASQLMNIKASQILRFYYSRQGLAANSGVCHRKLFIETSLNDDLVEEARKYLVIWNSFFLSGLHPQSKIDGYIESSKEKIFDLIRKTTQMNDEEKKLCLAIDRNVDIKDQPCETNSDVFFLLDVIKTCRPKQFCRQASMVRKLSKNLNMKRNHGSISIFYNAESMMNPYLLDDQMRIISPPLYSVLYNSTSSECAACKALYGDTSATRIIRNRVDLFEQIKRLMDQFDAIEQNRTGVPGKVFYWFDFGSVDNIPQETIQNIRYEKFRRHLLYLQRDINFFGISTNISTMTDIIKDRNRLAAVGPGGLGDTQAIQSLVDQSCQIQSVFQYNACHSTPSNQIVYEGYITPNYKQYWIMYPRHFIKSYRIEFKFRAENSLIKVCYDRTAVPERDEKKCRTNNEIDKDLILIVQNPCKEKTIENCPPIYFTITLHEPNGINQPCTNYECNNIKQYRWFFTHSGISCNGSISSFYSDNLGLFLLKLIVSILLINKFCY